VSGEYKLQRGTLHLAIDLVDRYLSKEMHIGKQDLQLIGVTCLFTAAKIEVCLFI
jgi:cyclin E